MKYVTRSFIGGKNGSEIGSRLSIVATVVGYSSQEGPYYPVIKNELNLVYMGLHPNYDCELRGDICYT